MTKPSARGTAATTVTTASRGSLETIATIWKTTNSSRSFDRRGQSRRSSNSWPKWVANAAWRSRNTFSVKKAAEPSNRALRQPAPNYFSGLKISVQLEERRTWSLRWGVKKLGKGFWRQKSTLKKLTWALFRWVRENWTRLGVYPFSFYPKNPSKSPNAKGKNNVKLLKVWTSNSPKIP